MQTVVRLQFGLSVHAGKWELRRLQYIQRQTQKPFIQSLQMKQSVSDRHRHLRSYLSMENIISATVVSGADAIHPGFGFLSENSKFAELCEQCGITFIGPPANVIAKLGNKQEARNTMEAAGVPVIPGSKEPVCEVHTGLLLAREIGYPVIIKAALGGGGKGMRVAYSEEEFTQSFQTAQKESQDGIWR